MTCRLVFAIREARGVPSNLVVRSHIIVRVVPEMTLAICAMGQLTSEPKQARSENMTA